MKASNVYVATRWKEIVCVRVASIPLGLTYRGRWIPIKDGRYVCLKYRKIIDWDGNGDPIESDLLIVPGPFWVVYNREENGSTLGSLRYMLAWYGTR
jgi:hypothetical protein